MKITLCFALVRETWLFYHAWYVDSVYQFRGTIKASRPAANKVFQVRRVHTKQPLVFLNTAPSNGLSTLDATRRRRHSGGYFHPPDLVYDR